jgi:transcription elongation regulator 1
LNLTPDALEQRWHAWKRSRETEARQEFDQMLGENSFVEFWGGMRKKVVDEEASKVKEEEEREEGEGLGEGGAADLVGMAGKIDLDEIKSVLRVSLEFTHRTMRY